MCDKPVRSLVRWKKSCEGREGLPPGKEGAPVGDGLRLQIKIKIPARNARLP